MKIINKKINLTDLLDKQVYKKDIIYLLKILSEEDLFIPFNNNHLIELYTSDDKIYIPLFTSIKQTSGLIYTRLDKVKLEIVIKDIFSLGKYYAISINPFTNDFIKAAENLSVSRSLYSFARIAVPSSPTYPVTMMSIPGRTADDGVSTFLSASPIAVILIIIFLTARLT